MSTSALQRIHIPITGLTCAGCVRRATSALTSVNGVSEVSVNLATASAEFSLTDNTLLPTVTSALLQAGYPTRLEQIELHIANMHCASCVSKIEKSVLALPGVLKATVNFASNTLELTRIAGLAGDHAVLKAIAAAGYQGKVQSAENTDLVQEQQQAQQRLSRQFWLALLLSLPVFVLEMGSHLLPELAQWLQQVLPAPYNGLLQFVLTSVVLLGPGRHFFTTGLPNLWRRSPDMNSLVALGTLAAWSYSSIVLFLPSLLLVGSQHLYFESAVVIVTLILLGRWLEGRARGQTGAAIQRLLGLQVKTVRIKRDDDFQDLPINELQTQMQFLVRPGERIAADAEVVSGESWVDEAMLSGEPMPVAKAAGAKVTAGTVNGEQGSLLCRATAVGEQTVLAQIVRLVQQAQSSRLPIQALVDKVTAVFVPVVLAIALLTALLWLWLGSEDAVSFALVNAVAVLIIACPCAMGLATPVSIMVGTGRAAELGILFRQGDALQQLQQIKLVAFDKTGTLTAGKMQLTDVHCADGVTKEHVLALVAGVEQHAEHPLAQALLAAAKHAEVKPLAATEFKALTGFGVSAQVDAQPVLLGSAALLAQQQISVAAFDAQAKNCRAAGKTVIYLTHAGKLLALLAIADQLRADSKDAVRQLQQAGLRVVMVSGDNQYTANAVAAELGITDVRAQVLPADKQAVVQALQREFGKVAFVGDGINDAPALAAADVGIAIGSGTDIAIDAADVVLQRSEVMAVYRALGLSRAVMRNIKQNLFWAFAYNIVLIPVAAGVLYPVAGILLAPGLAAAAMAMSSVFVLTNALRLRQFR
ncbi:heavy metal translocating P-type ATPase [Alishewanella sp. 16-MA]|uniref:Heavy metal translocating P-type ATPase n=1 Tax=Alishewanella maricola TaxID=2795740 RepID=A0ABS8C5T4_9ALTE|nr:heavy metal translocating P-type ATPase [Alishewanella maricola]MCB5227693.1 heavy metal translocating P-type ATPase [Alishewanella maricola]